MRLFIGISPSDDMRRALAGTQESLARSGINGAYLAPENLHMTLAFIGEYPEAEQVSGVMAQAAFDPFEIVYDHIGTFRESIVWGGIESCGPLEELVQRLRRALAAAGIPFSDSAFVPHFTLVRHADFSHGLPDVPVAPVPMTVDQIVLFRSDRGENGMVYTPVGAVAARRPIA